MGKSLTSPQPEVDSSLITAPWALKSSATQAHHSKSSGAGILLGLPRWPSGFSAPV